MSSSSSSALTIACHQRVAEIDAAHLGIGAHLAGSPSAMMRPWCSTAIFCAIENTTSMSCSVNSSVSPRSRGDAFEQRDRLVRLARRHAGGRLVEQQDLGIARQRDAELELLLVAVGQRAGDCPRLAGKADRGEQRLGFVAIELVRARPEIRPRPRWTRKAACTFSNTVSLGKMLVRWNERPMPMRQILMRRHAGDVAAVDDDTGRRSAADGR